MPNWNEILDEIQEAGSTHDIVRRRYLRRLSKLTGRNVIVYYSGWLQSADGRGPFAIVDQDKIGFMSASHKIDHNKGLDLILHTPGGETAATESIVDYLHKMFTDIRVIVPQIALSAGTMIACSARSIVMGKQSSLGPIDPQFRGLPAHGVIEEFNQAHQEIKSDPSRAAIWQPIIAKYTPTLIGECQKAIAWSEQMVREWLLRGMLCGQSDAEQRADTIIAELGSHALTLSHSRHLSAEKCASIGLVVERLENDQKLQDAVLSVHHACIHTLSSTPASKIIENHKGVAFINTMKQILVQR
jgi:ATP-dependent protease ClpP protease subunit